MWNQILCIIFLTIPSTFQGLALEQMLDPDNGKSKKWIRVLSWTFLYGICVVFKILTNNPNSDKMISLVISFLLQALALGYFYKNPVWQKILSMFALFSGVSFSEIGLVVVIQVVDIYSMMQWDYTRIEMVVACIVGAIFSIIGIMLVSFIWKFAFHKGKTTKYLWVYIIYAIYQSTSVSFMKYAIVDGNVNYSIICAVAVSLICNLVLLFVVFNQAERESLKEKYKEIQQKARLEQIHYQEMLHRREALANISQKNNQAIRSIQSFLKNNEKEKAEAELVALLQQVDATKEYEYCSIPIINVILSEKQKECQKEKIKFEVDLNLPEQLNIKQMDLCSIFSNLLDNAIRASSQMMKKAERYTCSIALKANISGNYLIIKCINSALREPGIIPEGTGYGLRILGDIAKRYKGDFRTSYNDGIFSAQLSIQFR